MDADWRVEAISDAMLDDMSVINCTLPGFDVSAWVKLNERTWMRVNVNTLAIAQ